MHAMLLVLFLSVPLCSDELVDMGSYKRWNEQWFKKDEGWRHNIYIMQSMDEKKFKIHCSGANFTNKRIGITYYGLKDVGIHPSEKGIKSFIRIAVDGNFQYADLYGDWINDGEIAYFDIASIAVVNQSKWIKAMKKGKKAQVIVSVYDRFGNDLKKKKFEISLDGFTCMYDRFNSFCANLPIVFCNEAEKAEEK